MTVMNEDRWGKVKRVVVGVDGSQPSKDALKWAADQAQLTGAKLRVVMTWVTPGTPYGYAVPMAASIDLGAEAKVSLEEIIEEVLGEQPAVQVSPVVMEGNAAPVLLSEARDADLLVVGSRGHGAFVGMLIGSVSEHCVTHATCPVVVVRHPR